MSNFEIYSDIGMAAILFAEICILLVFLRNATANSPERKCEKYLDTKNGSCSKINTIVCDINTCNIRQEYLKECGRNGSKS